MTIDRILLGPDWADGRLSEPGKTLLRLIGPGSLPLAFFLFLVSLAIRPTPPYDPSFIGLGSLEPLGFFVPLVLAVVVVFAGHRPGAALALLALATALFAMGPSEHLLLGGAVAILVVGIGFRRRHSNVLTATYAIAGLIYIVGLFFIRTAYTGSDMLMAGALSAAGIAVTLVIGYSVRAKTKGREKIAKVEKDTAEERGQRQLLESRALIAREMHDVVAHHMSVIAVQASTAEYRISGLSSEARAEFTSIADSARESLTEMRRLLGVLRRADETGERMPQPGIEGIEALVEGAGRAGTDVSVTIPDDLPELPDAVSLTAYRIVQEALSNAVRHAGGAPARVELYVEDEWLVVLVMNESPPMTADDTPPPDAAGLGLAGMRERVALLKGELVAEKLGRAGFVVKARLPLAIAEDA